MTEKINNFKYKNKIRYNKYIILIIISYIYSLLIIKIGINAPLIIDIHYNNFIL